MRNLIALFFVLCCLFTASEIFAEWIPGPVDTLTSNDLYDETGPQALAIDPLETLHVVWRQGITPGGAWAIWYRSKPSNQEWSPAEEMPTTAERNGVPSIVVDPSGYLHVVWDGFLDTNSEIFYATKTDLPGWDTAVLTGASKDDKDHLAPTIAVDSSGNVHVAWVGQDTLTEESEIFYATNTSGEWIIQMVEESEDPSPPGMWGTRPSIGVTPDGVAHIAYSDCDQLWCEGSVHHLENSLLGGTTWADETLETRSFADMCPSIVVEEGGALHVVMHGASHPDLPASALWGHCFYRSSPSEPWDSVGLPYSHSSTCLVPQLDESGAHHIVGDFSWLGVDNNIYLSYYTDLVGDWKRKWSILPEDASISLMKGPSFVLDQSGFGHVVFCSNPYWTMPRGELHYTRSAQPLTSAPLFIRGDVNADGEALASDALHLLKYLYVPGSPVPSCFDAADVDDNGTINMNDAMEYLKWLYVPGWPLLQPPWPDCGTDPRWDDLGCGSYPPCE